MASAVVAVEKREELGFEATELRLGLPGDGEGSKSSGKRGFAETIDLKLKLPTIELEDVEEEAEKAVKRSTSKKNLLVSDDDEEKPPAPKAQVVGWPPVRSFRRNIMSVQSDKGKKDDGEKSGTATAATFVKVSMDGAPYLRKVDLKMYKSYEELSTALEQMFNSFTAEYVPTYEDKDGDWMLVGDVPWEMFVDSCKRLRIMKGSEAIGLAPRAMEKFKNRS